VKVIEYDVFFFFNIR